MSLAPGCPRCSAPLTEWDDTWACADHGPIAPLWRPSEATYEEFGDLLRTAGAFPTYLPWPMSPGWSITDFGVVASRGGGAATGDARASVTCSSGTSALDGPVDVLVISEEPGTGLGARCAGVRHTDPDVGEGPPAVRVRIESQAVPLWALSTCQEDREIDRSVVAGEAGGRWLWLVLRPASAVLLLRDDWILRDVSGVGPPLLDMRFGGGSGAW